MTENIQEKFQNYERIFKKDEKNALNFYEKILF